MPIKRIIRSNALDALQGLDKGSVDLIYIDPPFFTQSRQGTARSKGYSDSWANLEGYLEFLTEHLELATDVLTDDGVICVHLDYRAVHFIKCIMDEIYPVFINHVVWCYNSGGAGKRNFARKHDDLLFFSKSNDYTFNVLREPYPRDYGDRPGFHKDGRALNDWWVIPIMSTTAKERCGYPNQKPVALLERIIRVFSNKGDTVLDFFCGSGTTGVAAKKLRRSYILVDNNREAITHTKARLKGS